MSNIIAAIVRVRLAGAPTRACSRVPVGGCSTEASPQAAKGAKSTATRTHRTARRPNPDQAGIGNCTACFADIGPPQSICSRAPAKVRIFTPSGDAVIVLRAWSVEIFDLPHAVLAYELHGATRSVGHRRAVADLFELRGGQRGSQGRRDARHLVFLAAF